MEKARRMQKIWLAVVILTAVTGVLGIPGIVLSALSGMYFLMAISIALVAHALYGITFYALAMARASREARVLKAVSDYGALTISEYSEATGITEQAVAEAIVAAIKRGWLTGYKFDGYRLSHVIAPERRCPFCSTVYQGDTLECPSCGAPTDKIPADF